MLQARDDQVARNLRATADASTLGSGRRTTPVAGDLGTLPVAELSDLVAEHTLVVRRCEAAVLDLACAWADRFPAPHPGRRLTRRQRDAATDHADTLTPPTGPDPARPL
ncbi:hypothetical protein DT076_10310, partial [Desertihabitans brevis]